MERLTKNNKSPIAQLPTVEWKNGNFLELIKQFKIPLISHIANKVFHAKDHKAIGIKITYKNTLKRHNGK